MKRILSILLITTMIISLSACGNTETSNNDNDRVKELEARISELETQNAELQKQLTESTQGATGNNNSNNNSGIDSETQELITYTSENADYQGICGADAKWYYKDNVLVIKGTGEITDNPWKSDEYKNGSSRVFNINWVIIDEGITSICDHAFFYEEDIAKAILPSTLKKIDERAFEYCFYLTSINIPDGVTSIGEYAFSDCKSLTNITIPDSVTSIGDGAFMSCGNLVSINIPDSVTSIGDRAFRNCKSLDDSTIEKIKSINPDAINN